MLVVDSVIIERHSKHPTTGYIAGVIVFEETDAPDTRVAIPWLYTADELGYEGLVDIEFTIWPSEDPNIVEQIEAHKDVLETLVGEYVTKQADDDLQEALAIEMLAPLETTQQE